MPRKLSIVIQIILVLAALAGSVYVAFTPANSLMHWYGADDAFYYYKVAINFLGGHGFSFDGINLSNGFHPLWMVVCLSIFWLAHFNLILPLRVLVVVSGLFNAATSLILFRLLERHIHPAAAIVGAFLWALLPSIYSVVTVNGLETPISAFFIILLVSKASEMIADPVKITTKQMVVLGGIGVLTILARLDNVFLVAVIGFFVLFGINRLPKLLMNDLVVITFAMMLSWVLRFGLQELRYNSYSIYPTLALAILIKPVCYYFCGMYKGFGDRKGWQKLMLQLVAALINFFMIFGIYVILYKLGILNYYSRQLLVIDAILCSAFIFCLRLFCRKTGNPVPSPFLEAKQWIHKQWKHTLLQGSAFALPIAIGMGIYVACNKIIFGTFSPISGKVKVWWSTLPNTVYAKSNSLLMLLGLDPNSSEDPWSLITSSVEKVVSLLTRVVRNDSSRFQSLLFLGLFILLVFAVIAILNSNSQAAGGKAIKLLVPALLFGSLFRIAYYNLVGYQAMRAWYWVAEMMTITILVAVVLDPFFSWLDEFKPKPLWAIAVTLLTVAILCTRHVNYLLGNFPAKVAIGSEQNYIHETRELEMFTEPGSKIGMTGGGLVGYFIKNRTIVNLDGLINSVEYFNDLKNGAAQTFLDALGLNYVYGNSYMLKSSDPYKDFLSGRLVEIGVIKGYDNFTLYRYEPNQ